MQGQVDLIGRLHVFALTHEMVVGVLEYAWRARKVVQNCRIKVHQATGSAHGQKVIV